MMAATSPAQGGTSGCRRHRPHDVRAVIDELERLNAAGNFTTSRA
jgi:hypothetical protein